MKGRETFTNMKVRKNETEVHLVTSYKAVYVFPIVATVSIPCDPFIKQYRERSDCILNASRATYILAQASHIFFI